jgi:uncharacterized protein (UPF0248 family)
MQPVQELLHRIRWDPAFSEADFEIGYYDRVEDRVLRVPFSALHFPEDDHFAFEFCGLGGEVHCVPFHRVREIYRNGRSIWRREGHCMGPLSS